MTTPSQIQVPAVPIPEEEAAPLEIPIPPIPPTSPPPVPQAHPVPPSPSASPAPQASTEALINRSNQLNAMHKDQVYEVARNYGLPSINSRTNKGDLIRAILGHEFPSVPIPPSAIPITRRGRGPSTPAPSPQAPPTPPSPAPPTPLGARENRYNQLNAMRKEQLLDLNRSYGIHVTTKTTKPNLIQTILNHEYPSALASQLSLHHHRQLLKSQLRHHLESRLLHHLESRLLHHLESRLLHHLESRLLHHPHPKLHHHPHLKLHHHQVPKLLEKCCKIELISSMFCLSLRCRWWPRVMAYHLLPKQLKKF